MILIVKSDFWIKKTEVRFVIIVKLYVGVFFVFLVFVRDVVRVVWGGKGMEGGEYVWYG